MNVMPLLLFVSLVLATSAVLFFLWNQLRGNSEHTDRLAVLPFMDELDQSSGAHTKAPLVEEERPDDED